MSCYIFMVLVVLLILLDMTEALRADALTSEEQLAGEMDKKTVVNLYVKSYLKKIEAYLALKNRSR